jgi:hypothetical protein
MHGDKSSSPAPPVCHHEQINVNIHAVDELRSVIRGMGSPGYGGRCATVYRPGSYRRIFA